MASRRDRMLLLETDTEGAEFSPHSSWWLGCDVYSADAELEWLSPGDVWVPIYTISGLQRQWVQSWHGDTYRITTATAGSRVWGTW